MVSVNIVNSGLTSMVREYKAVFNFLRQKKKEGGGGGGISMNTFMQARITNYILTGDETSSENSNRESVTMI